MRFVVLIDVEADSVDEGYRKLLERMSGNDWESSDEAYTDGGTLIDYPVLQAARLRVLGKVAEDA